MARKQLRVSGSTYTTLAMLLMMFAIFVHDLWAAALPHASGGGSPPRGEWVGAGEAFVLTAVAAGLFYLVRANGRSQAPWLRETAVRSAESALGLPAREEGFWRLSLDNFGKGVAEVVEVRCD